MTEASYATLPFSEQIAFFRGKKNVLTGHWTDLWEAEHDHGYMVAGADRIDLLVDLREAVDKVIADGAGIAQFRKDFAAIVQKHGWSYNGGFGWRTRVIYETNLRSSYAAGRYAQLQAVKEARPYWRYRHSDSVQHPRLHHLAWGAKPVILHADHPWWSTHYPPNGWGCKCTVEALNDRDLERLGKSGPDGEAPDDEIEEVEVGKRGPNPRTVRTPAGIDPGFGYAPGRSAFEQLAQSVVEKAAALPARAAAQALQPLLALPRAQAGLDEGFARWFDQVNADPLPRGRIVPVGALSPQTVDWLRTQAEIEPATASISMRDDDLLHAKRDSKTAGLSDELLRQIPRMLRDRQAVLFDKPNRTLLYVFGGTGAQRSKLVIRVNYKLKGATEAELVNLVRTGAFIDRRALTGAIRGGQMELIEGEL